ARTLEMVFDPPEAGIERGDNGIRRFLGRHLRVGLKDLLALHGWETRGPNRNPLLPAAAEALREIHADPVTRDRWGGWLSAELYGKTRHREGARREQWRTEGELAEVSLAWPGGPSLRAVAEALRAELGLGGAGTLDFNAAGRALRAQAPRMEKPRTVLREWLAGKWLE